MKLLFDQNLSRHLCQRIADLFPDSSHVVFHRLAEASDAEVWSFAIENGYCIVSRDADFAEQSRLRGAPPKIVWLRCGNCTAAELEAILRRNATIIRELGNENTLSYVELF